MTNRASLLCACVLVGASLPILIVEAPAGQASSETQLIATLHAEGVQIYECKAAASGSLAWQFREPLATLMQNGRTVGWHYAGPSWQLDDGSAVVAKVTARAPGATPEDIPLLWLEVESHRGRGQLSEVGSIERANTKGGVASGACGTIGALLSVPYSADYSFVRRPE